MDDETRAAFDDIRREIRRGFVEVNGRFDRVDVRFAVVDGHLDAIDGRLDTVDGRLDAIDGRLDAIDGRLDTVDGRFLEANVRVDTLEERFLREIRQLGVMSEDLRDQVQLVAEGVIVNGRAIERLRAEMNERFRENEIIVGGAFRQIRRDIDEIRG